MTIIRILDFETTGTELPAAEVCEVGYCDFDVEARVVEDPVTWLCGVKAMPPEVQAVHHISILDCAGRPPFNPGDIDSPGVDAYAAHYADFELQFYSPPAYMICTYKAALRVWPEAPSHSNQVLRYWLERQGLLSLDSSNAMPPHRAGPDAYVTAHVLKALFDAGITGREMIGWTKEPALLPRCTIGKFRGTRWEDVESGFLLWMVKQADMAPDLKWNAQRELGRRGS